jgi:hypothetical protein
MEHYTSIEAGDAPSGAVAWENDAPLALAPNRQARPASPNLDLETLNMAMTNGLSAGCKRRREGADSGRVR